MYEIKYNKHNIINKIGIMKKTILKTFMAIAILITATLFIGCEKNEFEQQPINGEMVLQTFGLVGVSDIDLKTWSLKEWDINYNPTTTLLTLTGINGTTKNYSVETTIQDLINGTVTIEMMTGEYAVSFETTHITTTNTSWFNGLPNHISSVPYLSENIDIKIQHDVNITGNPIELQAQVMDLLIIWDVPNKEHYLRIVTDTYWDDKLKSYLLPFTDNTFKWGYFAMDNRERGLEQYFAGLRVVYDTGVIDAKDWQLGKIYHIRTPLQGAIEIDIPLMTVEEIIVE